MVNYSLYNTKDFDTTNTKSFADYVSESEDNSDDNMFHKHRGNSKSLNLSTNNRAHLAAGSAMVCLNSHFDWQ